MTSRIAAQQADGVTAVVLVGLIVAGAAWSSATRSSAQRRSPPTSLPPPRSIPSDEVRVSGVKVGNIKSIQPEGTRAKMTLEVDRGVPIPADAKAVIVAPNLVAARYVQLTPAYRTSGPGHARRRGRYRSNAPQCLSSGTRSKPN